MNRPAKRRSQPTGLAKRSRNKKALFLPMDRQTVDELVLPVRIAFERIRQERVDRDAAACMAEILLLTGFLTEAGFGLLSIDFLNDLEQRVLTELNQGGVDEEWRFAPELVDALGVVVNEYDRLMRETRLHAIVKANECFARLRQTARKD